jgi:hypothetical protein
MNKKTIIIVIVVAVGFLATIFLMGNTPLINEPEELTGDEFSIKSDDGQAELTITKNNLPDNVDIEDISVTRIVDDQYDDNEWIIYELEPDGLEFKNPVLFNVSYESVNDTIPIVFLSYGGEVELVNNTFSEINLENNSRVISIPLTHFCKACLYKDSGAFKVDASAQDTICGEQILTDASFTLIKDSILFEQTYKGKKYWWEWKFIESKVLIKGIWENNRPYPISPEGQFGGKPGLTSVSVGETVTFQDDTFKCINPQYTSLTYFVEITFNAKTMLYNSEADYLAGKGTVKKNIYKQKHLQGLHPHVRCMEEVEEEEPKTDPGIQPEVELDYDWNYKGDYVVNKTIHVDIKARYKANGTVTLSGPSTPPIIKTVIIKNIPTRVSFTVYHYGEYTVIVDIDDFIVMEKIIA